MENSKSQKVQQSLAEQIQDRTGFILEHNVATLLEQQGWIVIHNRFYLDDVLAAQREIDLLVYKVREIDNILVYTTLIISCKKSEFKDWIFLTRNAIGTKTNVDTVPFTYWTNSEVVNFQMKKAKFLDLKYCSKELLVKLNNLFDYENTVFGFREYDNKKQGDKLVNDTGIYESIITLIKSQAYELESLPLRKKDQLSYYNINLLTVADVAKFIEIRCDQAELMEKEISRIKYVNRFLVNKREHSSRIVFCKFTELPNIVEEYNILHEANCETIFNAINTFYSKDIINAWEAREIILSNQAKGLMNSLKWEVRDKVQLAADDFDNPYFNYDTKKELWVIELNASEALIEFLTHHKKALKITSDWLKKHFRYTGNYAFAINELPF